MTSTPSMPSGGTAFRSTTTLSDFMRGPGRARHHLDARGPRVEQHVGALEHLGALRRVGHGRRLDVDVEPRADELPRLLALLRLARSDGDLGAVVRQQPGRALAHRPGAGEDDDLLALEVAQRLLDLHHRGDGGRVRAVRVEHDRDRNGSNSASCAIASSCSPADMLLPPIQTAVLWRSFAPRVKMQPWIRSRTSLSVTPP